MIGQLWALLVLKYHINRHTFTAGKLVSGIFLAIIGIAGAVFTLGGSIALFRLAAFSSIMQHPYAILAAMDIMIGTFLLMWGGGLLSEIQRGDVIDFRKMLYLPVSLRTIYTLNFAASLFRPANLIFLPLFTAFAAGLMYRDGAIFAPALGLGALFLLMFGAWAYYARGLFAILMENKRRRAYVITLASMLLVIVAQLPNLFLQQFRGEGGRYNMNLEQSGLDEWLLLVNRLVPPGWLAYGVHALRSGESTAVWLCAAGLALMTLIGLLLGYRATVRYFMHGATTPARKKSAVPVNDTAEPFTLRGLPPFDAETAALIRAFFLGFLRHPYIRMQMIMPFFMGFIMVFFVGRRGMGGDFNLAELDQSYWLLPAVLIWPFAGFVNVFFNQFGVDRDAFRAMVLLPAPRHRYLLAKNAALFPFVASLVSIFLIAAFLLVGMSFGTVAQGFLLMLQLFLAYCTAGNFISLYFPYRFQHSGMGAPSRFGNRFGMSFAYLGGTLIIFSPALLCLMAGGLAPALGIPPAFPAALLAAALLLAITAVIWRISLIHAGDILHLREQRILATLIKDRE